jgi:hypothetical protein
VALAGVSVAPVPPGMPNTFVMSLFTKYLFDVKSCERSPFKTMSFTQAKPLWYTDCCTAGVYSG